MRCQAQRSHGFLERRQAPALRRYRTLPPQVIQARHRVTAALRRLNGPFGLPAAGHLVLVAARRPGESGGDGHQSKEAGSPCCA
jgi:hypothetical protein